MLTALRIKNLALVEDLALEFQPGYNAITGETGAGKSILIGALSLVLGERADRNLIRGGCDACSVEAIFDVSHLKAPLPDFLEANGIEPCEGNALLLKRTFSAAGTNRQFINGTATVLNTLAMVGEWLVDIHGPYDHQSLLQPARQLSILDEFGGLSSERKRFAELARRKSALETEKAGLIVDEKTYAQQLDLLRFQVQEIRTAQLQEGEEANVAEEHRRAQNAARLLELAQAVHGLLSDEEGSLLNRAGAMGRLLQELRNLDSATAPLLDHHEQAVASLHELQNELSRYSDRVELDPERLESLEQRLNLIQSLKRKYGPTLAEVINHGALAASKLRALEQRETELERINQALKNAVKDLRSAGQELAARRRKVIPSLCRDVRAQLEALGFQQCQFDVAIRTDMAVAEGNTPISQAGFDTVEFQFAPNPGEPPRPLRAIASSGELARVMLALKTVLAAEDEVPVLIFDEVDANIGGETARAVGEKMLQIAQHRQVLCITHLAPVAAEADAHFVVRKQIQVGRTTTQILRLSKEERIQELARMLGSRSEASLEHAAELLGKGKKRKREQN